MYYCIAETVCEQGEQSLNHQSTDDVVAAVSVVSNPVTSEDNGLKDNYTKKEYFLVQIIATGEKSFDRLNMDCPIQLLQNMVLVQKIIIIILNQRKHTRCPNTVEAPQSIDHQNTD